MWGGIQGCSVVPKMSNSNFWLFTRVCIQRAASYSYTEALYLLGIIPYPAVRKFDLHGHRGKTTAVPQSRSLLPLLMLLFPTGGSRSTETHSLKSLKPWGPGARCTSPWDVSLHNSACEEGQAAVAPSRRPSPCAQLTLPPRLRRAWLWCEMRDPEFHGWSGWNRANENRRINRGKLGGSVRNVQQHKFFPVNFGRLPSAVVRLEGQSPGITDAAAI